MKHDWKYKKIGNLCDIKTGRLDANAADENGTYPFFTCSKETLRINTFAFDCECVLIAGNGELNAKYYKGKFNAYQRTYVITLKNEVKDVDVRYLYLFFSLYIEHLRNVSIGGVIKYIKLGDLTEAVIPVPSLPTQQSIVSELDSLSKIIADCKETLKDYDALEQSIFYDMFGDPVKNDKGWEVKKVEDIGSCCSGGTPSRSHPEYFEGDIIWYSAGELNDLYLGESIEKITESALNNSSAKLCKAGSLFVGMYDTAAFKMGIATVDSCSNQACANVTLNDNNNVIWLYFTLLFMKEEALKNRHGARQKNLNLGYIKNFNIPVPPLPLQQQFASKIEAIEQMKEETKKALQEAETLFQARMDYWFN